MADLWQGSPSFISEPIPRGWACLSLLGTIVRLQIIETKEWVHFPSRGASLAEAVILRPFVPVTGSPALFAACPGVLSCHSFLRVHSNIWGNYFLVGGIYNPSFLKVTNSCNSTTMKERYKGKFLPASLFPSLQPTSSDIEVADACWMEPISQGPNTSTVSSNLVYL